MSRDEHMKWCKERALAYLPGDPANAMASMMSDIGKHDDTRGHIGLMISPMMYGKAHDAGEMRKWIEGFN